MEEEMRVAKRCPKCGQRVFDKLSAASGFVEVKCPRCGAVVRFNLAYRTGLSVPRRPAFAGVRARS